MCDHEHEEIARTLDETFDGCIEAIEAAMDDDLGDELLGLGASNGPCGFPRCSRSSISFSMKEKTCRSI